MPAGADTAVRDGASVADFYYEAVVSANLDHPGVVPILDFGVSQDGCAFYAMQKVNGTSWHRLLPTMSLEENLAVLDKVADIVGHAHARGILHRDIKPANIILGNAGEVWLADWGVAIQKEVDGGFRHAPPGGTPHYMAPEMAACDMARLGYRSDVYLLGATLATTISAPYDTPK